MQTQQNSTATHSQPMSHDGATPKRRPAVAAPRLAPGAGRGGLRSSKASGTMITSDSTPSVT